MDQEMRRSLTFFFQLLWLAGQGYLFALLFCLIGQRHSAKGAHPKLAPRKWPFALQDFKTLH
jgi:hypothetical protein